MKKFLATLLTLTLLATFLFVAPVSAATSFVSNMTGWAAIRGTWDFATGDVTSATGNNYASPVETTVKKDDNWSWNMDVVTENTAPNFQFQFGRATAAFTGVSMFYVQTTADAKVRLYYNDGSAATNYTGWIAFPSGSASNNFNIKIVMLNAKCYVYIDNNCIITHDMSATPYNGGYFGISNSKVAANYNNINLYVNNEALSVIGGYFLPSDNGFATANSTQRWNQAYVSNAAVGKYLTIETDYKCNSGNNQSYIRFGLIDDSNYFSVNMQPNDANGSQFAIYELVAGTNTRRSAWVSGPSGFDPSNFKVKLVLTPDNCELYINGTRILTTTINYTPGRFGLATYYTSAQFNNFKITKSHGSDTAFTPVTNAKVVDNGISFTSATNWNKANLGVATNGDFEISANMKSIEGNNQLYLYFGASTTNFADGYSVRIQSSNGVSQAVVYRNSTNKRVSAWCNFPEGSDISDFELKLKYINKVAMVYIDGVRICISEQITTDGGYTALHTYKTVAEVTDVTSCIPQAMPYDVSRDDAVNSGDLSVLRRVLLGVNVAHDAAMADCNGDGATNVADIVRLKKYVSFAISIVDSNATVVESESAENYAYLANGSFNIKNAQADFDSEKPYVYLNQIGTVSGDFASLFANMGVYVTNNYTVSEIGVIAAEGNYTENTSSLTVDATDIAVTKTVLGATDSYAQYKLYVTDLPANTSRTIRAYLKLTDNEGNTSYVYSSNCCFFGEAELQ